MSKPVDDRAAGAWRCDRCSRDGGARTRTLAGGTVPGGGGHHPEEAARLAGRRSASRVAAPAPARESASIAWRGCPRIASIASGDARGGEGPCCSPRGPRRKVGDQDLAGWRRPILVLVGGADAKHGTSGPRSRRRRRSRRPRRCSGVGMARASPAPDPTNTSTFRSSLNERTTRGRARPLLPSTVSFGTPILQRRGTYAIRSGGGAVRRTRRPSAPACGVLIGSTWPATRSGDPHRTA